MINFKLIQNEGRITHVAVENSETQEVDQIEISHDGSFTHKDIQYIIFENILSLRQHHSTFEYDDKAIPTFAVISVSSAHKFLTWMATIHEHSLDYLGVKRLPSVRDALKMITAELKSQMDQMASDQDLQSMFNVFLNLLDQLISEITPEQIKIIYQYSDLSKLVIACTSISEMLQHSAKYLYQLLTYDPKMVERLSLTYPMQMLSYVLRIFLLLFSHFDISFTNHESILIHEVTAILIDLISDRLTTYVYLRGGNSFASGIIQQIGRKYPALASVQDIDKIPVFMANNRDFENFIRDSWPDFNLWPFILGMNMPIQQRVTFNIRACLDSINSRHERKMDISPNDVIQLMYNVCKPYVETHNFECYSESCFKQIINSSLFTQICMFLNKS
ncbi:uncharacterized LOC118063625 [Chelonus insularis]|uniref:uncharacterized LOC118063625 n=1 Tax=Chelonus insularis TaxID=460826 RepID=UPI0015895C17|nr:uncharacterized LOC118063625 [Chelonus insularis]KAG8148368.1 HzNVorf64-like protein [Chelonus insularis]